MIHHYSDDVKGIKDNSIRNKRISNLVISDFYKMKDKLELEFCLLHLTSLFKLLNYVNLFCVLPPVLAQRSLLAREVLPGRFRPSQNWREPVLAPGPAPLTNASWRSSSVLVHLALGIWAISMGMGISIWGRKKSRT